MSERLPRDRRKDPDARGARAAAGAKVNKRTLMGLGEDSGAVAPRRARGTLAAALAAAVLSLVVYLATAAPTVLPGDSGELQTVALLGGVAHPSGYPTFIMLGQLFGRVVPGDSAHRITVMSAVFGGTAVLAFGLLLAELGLTAAGVLVGTLLFATSFTVWWSAMRAEVYTLGMTCFLLSLVLALRALRGGRTRDFVLSAFLLGFTLTSHLAYAPPAALVLGVMAWRTRPWRGRNFSAWAGMAMAFVAGLLPYLYLMWADAHTEATNWLKYTIDLQAHQFGLTRETFHTPWQRIGWLMLGRGFTHSYLAQPWYLLRNLIDLLAHTFLFEVGPLALVPFALALRHPLRRLRPVDWVLAGVMFLSFGFGVASSHGRMAPIFTLPYGLMVLTFVAIGLDQMIGRAGLRSWPRWLVALAAFALIAPLPHALRAHAAWHPIGPRAWRVEEEGPPPIRSFIPRLDHFRESREVGERLLRDLPRGALVATDWHLFGTVMYLQLVEGQRPDITFIEFLRHLEHLRRWQERFDLRERPIVGVGVFVPQMRPYLDRPDSVAYAPGQYYYVQRTPLRLP